MNIQESLANFPNELGEYEYDEQMNSVIFRFKIASVDALNATQVKDVLFRICGLGVKYVFIDMATVKIIDSSGVGAMVGGIARSMKDDIKDVKIFNLSPQVKGIFEMLRLIEVFSVSENEQQAKQSVM